MSDLLQQPLLLANGSQLPNRLAKSAMSEALGTTDNRVTSALPVLYERWSGGGTGLLITGNVMIDRHALGEPNNVVLEDDRDMELLTAWANAASSQGSVCWMQLNHPGKQAPKGLNQETVAPSAIGFDTPLRRFFAEPRALELSEIENIIARFARSAQLAQQAGFSGVQIHGAHGYLVSQFLSAKHNRRQDRYGGTLENRCRFVLEVYQAIRAAVGKNFSVGIKLNSADFQQGGFDETESLQVIEWLAEAGIDLLEISGGTYEAPVMSLGVKNTGTQKESTRIREAYFLEFAEKLRSRVKTPLMVTGGFRTHTAMEAALASGALDLIGMARPLAVDPEYSQQLLRGELPRHPVPARISTGVSAVDRMALMEVSWYTRQIQRMGKGRPPQPNESALLALAGIMVSTGWKTWRTRRLRS